MPIKKDDFQDYELWRCFNYEILKYLNANFNTIIVPMTITNLQYYDEIIGKLKSEDINVKDFILIASKDNLLKRLDKRENSTEWTYKQIDRCVKTFDTDFKGQKIDTNDRNIDEITSNIIDLLKSIK